MKKVFLLFVSVVVTTVFALKSFHHEPSSDDLLIQNIEALAGSEISYQYCVGSGDVCCPNGTKVAYVLGGCR